MADLREAILLEAVAEPLHGPAEISHGLTHGWFHHNRSPVVSAAKPDLAGRETDVLRLIGRGFSNNGIARDLGLSVATVKQHFHHVLAKLGVGQRAHALRRVREQPWIGR